MKMCRHTGRISSVGEMVANHLSKGKGVGQVVQQHRPPNIFGDKMIALDDFLKCTYVAALGGPDVGLCSDKVITLNKVNQQR